MEFDFGLPVDGEEHKTESYREGEWIIFRCPICTDYERRINWKTGKMKVVGSKAHIRHSGKYYPHEFNLIYQSTN